MPTSRNANIWDGIPRRKKDEFTDAREEGLGGIVSDFDNLEDAEKHVALKDGGKCQLYGGLLASALAQAITVIVLILCAIGLLSLLLRGLD